MALNLGAVIRIDDDMGVKKNTHAFEALAFEEPLAVTRRDFPRNASCRCIWRQEMYDSDPRMQRLFRIGQSPDAAAGSVASEVTPRSR